MSCKDGGNIPDDRWKWTLQTSCQAARLTWYLLHGSRAMATSALAEELSYQVNEEVSRPGTIIMNEESNMILDTLQRPEVSLPVIT